MSKAPLFQSIFGVPWAELPPVMQKHYAVRPYSLDRVVVKVIMTIRRSRLVRFLSPLLNIFGALAPYDGENVPATVTFYSGPETSDFHIERVFEPPDKPAFRFHSRLVQVAGSDVIEYMRFGLGWRAHYRTSGNRVTLTHIGYYWRLGKFLIPVPFVWVLGKGAATEEVLTDNRFKMWMTITHPLFGVTYGYEGTFDIAAVTHG